MATLAEQWDMDVDPKLKGLNPDLADRVQQAQDAYRTKYGKELPITSGFRTTEQQAQLASKPNPYPVAKAGTSLHETGNAIDIDKNVPNEFLQQFGLHRPLGAKDPVHTTLMPQKTASFADLWESTPEPTGEVLKQPSEQPKTAKTTLETAFDLKKQLPGFLASTADVLASAPSAIASTAGYVVPRALGGISRMLGGRAESQLTPEEITQGASRVAGQLAQPVGRATGLAETEGYKQALPTQILETVGKYIGDSAEKISAKTGIPVQDVEAAFSTLGIAAGAVAPKIVKGFKQAKAELTPVGQQMQAQLDAKQGKTGSVGAASMEANPYANTITGEEKVRGEFPQVKLSKTPADVPVAEQQTRSKIVQEILGEGSPVRSGVITGNENVLRNEYTKAKLPDPTPESDILKRQIANEQIALSDYAKQRVEATGASPTLINEEQRGQRINDVFHDVSKGDETPTSLTGYLNQSKKQIYDSAYAKMGDNPIKSTNTDSFFGNAQQRATAETEGTLNVLDGAKKKIELAKTVGFELPDGKIAPAGSVAAFDAVRKSMNAGWSPEKANTIRKVNQAIDKDIASVADPALYKLGDKIHQIEKTIFSSKGIKSLFGELDANGVITSATPLEKITAKLNNLPKDQWRHVRDTLNDLANGRIRGVPEGIPAVPPELMQSAKAAVAEIDGALAREVYKAGASKVGEWNQNSANNVMNSVVGEKILETFPPSEIQKFHNLNYGGYLMPGIHQYEGAGLHVRRVQGIIEGNLGKIGASSGGAAGGAVAGPVGGAVGAYIGGQLGVKGAQIIEKSALKKSAQQLEAEMKRNSELSKTNLEDIGKKK
jgi:hypothetical protein